MDDVQIAVDEIDYLIGAAHNEGFGIYGADVGVGMKEDALIIYWKGKEYIFVQAHDDKQMNNTFTSFPCPVGCKSWDDCDESCK